ncbi:MAG: hypothetical protein ACXAEN_27335 [Candidatus Thorarchaeota archaeon]|jgi:hypothetical protein
MIQSAVSSALAIAGMYTASGVLAGVGMALMYVAAQVSFFTSAKVLKDFLEARQIIEAQGVRIDAIAASIRLPALGGGL